MSGTCTRFRGTDHPRSRGVYLRRAEVFSILIGSSPLARGLRFRPVLLRRASRIIPARAGFTYGFRRTTQSMQDHPRSRGVYASLMTWGCSMRGSSPLARGLLVITAALVGRRWIIPARAGFTLTEFNNSKTVGDHPRSRGVYCDSTLLFARISGSSPLARGLPPRSRFRGRGRGIIPARAGFTRTAKVPTPWSGDHPRSRGVYLRSPISARSAAGSSPLARGLRTSHRPFVKIERIIPARAGFTGHPDGIGLRSRDHPRSRGVYWLVIAAEVAILGSSPLARGLRNAINERIAELRIIPARAGFTPPLPEWRRESWDHPRSRGVYDSGPRTGAGSYGSSPLARGLRFLPRRESHPKWDHPRSRGVYSHGRDAYAYPLGSSPLARGLLGDQR